MDNRHARKPALIVRSVPRHGRLGGARWYGASTATALCVVLSGLGLVPATTATASPRAVPLTETFTFTGAPQTFTVPANTAVTITADGAGGGTTRNGSCVNGGTGGAGARVVTTLPASATPTPVTVNVGGAGDRGCSSNVGAAGGFNGGASGGAGPTTPISNGSGGLSLIHI